MATAFSLFAASVGCVADSSAPVAPNFTPRQREFLSRLARRTVMDAVRGRPRYEPDYVPEALGAVSSECVVRLRDHGYLLAAGAGGPGPIAAAVRDAADAAAREAPMETDPEPLRTEGWLIEIEAAGAPVSLPTDLDWSAAEALDDRFEPGVDGLVILTPGRARRVCPSEFITSDLPVADAVKLLAQSLQLNPERVRKTPLQRFRTLHWYEPADAAAIVTLHRGMTLVPQDAVSASGLKDTVDRLAEYLCYRQLASGLFTYQFDPGADRYRDEDNLVRQVGASLAMATHARVSGRSASLAAADSAIRFHLQGLQDFPGVEGAAFIATADGRHKLGVTALFSLTLAAHPQSNQYAALQEKLVAGMLALQHSSGMFVTAFPPAIQLDGQDYFPGEALLALAAEYDRQPSAKVLSAFDRAIESYRDYFDSSPSPAFVPWQVQAFAIMAKKTKRKDYADFVFKLSDWLAEKQLTPSNCPWPELHGGIAAYADSRAGVSTASYLEAFTDALNLARTVGDRVRELRYETVVRHAARFVMQLQVRAAEAYYARSPKDMIDAIRTGPALNRLRIDHCQHALLGLLKARNALFPSDGS